MSADLQSIYSRLNQGTQYTPLSAETFSDWSLEAGDVVTFKKAGESYKTPIMQNNLKWNGAAVQVVESTGGEERESLSRMSRKEYASGGGGGGGYWNSQKANTAITQNADAIKLEAWNREEEGKELYAAITVEAGRITQEVIDRSAGDATLSAAITVEANRITQEVTRATEAEGSLAGRITVEAGKISQIVEAVGADGQVTAASIVLSINQQTGESLARLDADKVLVGRGTVDESTLPSWMDATTGLVAQKATIVDLNAVKARVASIEADYITTQNLSSNIAALEYLSVHAIRGDGAIVTSGTINGGGDLQYKGTSLGTYLAEASVSGNVLTIKNGDGTVVATFSKATTLKGSWSGGKYTVTASPQDVSESTTLGSLGGTGSVTKSGKNVSQKQKVYYVGSSENLLETGAELTATIDASSVYNDGHTQGWADAYAKTSPLPGANTTDNFTFYYPSATENSGTSIKYTVSADKDYAYIKNAANVIVARVANVFKTTTVTLQGSADNNVYVPASDGTVYYTAGDSFTARGDSASVIVPTGGPWWYKLHASTETPSGSWYSRHDSNPGGTVSKVYGGGDKVTYYKGNGGSKTAVSSSSIMLKKATRYNAGSAATYYVLK